MYREGNVSSLQLSTDFLLKYGRKLGAGFDMKLNFGGSIINRMFRETTQTAEQLKQPGVYSLANSVERVKPNNYDYERQTNSLYGLIQISWRDAVFLDITGRNDWSSTLAPGYNSYFYPSFSGSVLLDQVFDFAERAPWVDLLKVRGSWANVGNDTDPYNLLATYANSPNFTGAYLLPSETLNYYIKPENVESWEVGLEASFFKKRLAFDVAYYFSETTDQISYLSPRRTGVGRSISTGRKTGTNWSNWPTEWRCGSSMRKIPSAAASSSTPIPARSWDVSTASATNALPKVRSITTKRDARSTAAAR